MPIKHAIPAPVDFARATVIVALAAVFLPGVIAKRVIAYVTAKVVLGVREHRRAERAARPKYRSQREVLAVQYEMAIKELKEITLSSAARRKIEESDRRYRAEQAMEQARRSREILEAEQAEIDRLAAAYRAQERACDQP
jgi:hypothetical protein